MAATGSAAAAAQPVDPMALQLWLAQVEGRLDEQATAITGVGLELQTTIGHAKGAMTAIVESVKVELLGFKRQVHNDHGQLNAVVAQVQQKFTEVEEAVNRVAQEFATRVASMDARATRAEQRIKELTALSLVNGGVYGTPPDSPRIRAGSGGASFAQHAGGDPWQAAEAAARAPLLQQPPGFAQAPAPAAAAPDPWQAAAAAARGAAQGQAPLLPPGTGAAPQHFGIGGKGLREPREFRVDNRAWGSNRQLDLVAAPDAYLVWHDRALGHLSSGRPDVRKLLLWAESQTREELEAKMESEAEQLGMHDAELVDTLLFEGIKCVIHDSLLTRARACNSSGLELWRRLHSEWEGSAPQLKHAKARKFQDPVRCSSVAGLWEALPEWERLGEEVRATGFDMPDWVRTSALEKLVPADLLTTLVGRPELDSYGQKLRWVKCQMEHSRGALQARAVAGGSKKDAMQVDELAKADGEDAAPGLASQTWSLQDQVSYMSAALQALTKGKGKGKGKDGGKAGGKAGGKSGVKGAVFDGHCHHCGKYGHRQNACHQLDKVMAGKGKGKGGKGLRELSAEEEEGAEEVEAEVADDWVLGPKLWAVAKDTRDSGRALLPHGCRNPPAAARLPSNRFACLGCADDGPEAPEDAEHQVFTGACSVFVKGLDRRVDDRALRDTFGLFGAVVACKVAGGAGNSRGYGFVHYGEQEAAQLAIERADGLLLGATAVTVQPFKGAMVRRKVASSPCGHTFAHYATEKAAMQAIAAETAVEPGSRKVEPGPRAAVIGRGLAAVRPGSAPEGLASFASVRAAAAVRPGSAPDGTFVRSAVRPGSAPEGLASVARTRAVAAVRPGSAPEGLASFARERSKEAAHLACLAATRAALAARRDPEGDFQVVGRRGAGGPKATTLGDCIAAAGPARSQREKKAAAAQHGCRNPLGSAAAGSRWQPSLGGGRAALSSLQRDLPGGLVGAVAREGGVVEAVVDSGAEESVAPPNFFAAAVVPSPMSKAGGKYRAANGTRIRNLGQQQVAFTTAEGHKCAMPFQVAEVERPLISVAQLTSAGNSVVLNDTGGQIVNAVTGKTIELVRRGGVYLLLMNVGIGVALGFPRQGK